MPSMTPNQLSDGMPLRQEESRFNTLEKVAAALSLSLTLGCSTTPEELQLEERIMTEVNYQLNARWNELEQAAEVVARNKAERYLKEHLTEIYKADRDEVAKAVIDDLLARKFDEELSVTTVESSIREANFSPDFLRIKQMKEATVQIEGKYDVGTGVIVYSGPVENSARKSVVLTCYHVVRNILSEEDTKKNGISCTIYKRGGQEIVQADLIGHDKEKDLALLCIRGERLEQDTTPYFLPKEQLSLLQEGTEISTYGGQLGVTPFLSEGKFTLLGHRKSDSTYNMVSAPAFMGNSGAGIWHFIDAGDQGVPLGFYVGMYAKIYTHGSNPTMPIPHMGLSVPPEEVYDFLALSGLVPNAQTLQLEALPIATFGSPEEQGAEKTER